MSGDLRLEGNVNLCNNSAGTFTVAGDANPTGLLIGGRITYTSGATSYVNNSGYIKIGNCTGSNIYQPGTTTITGGAQTANPRVQLQTTQPTASICQSGLLNFSTAISTTFSDTPQSVGGE